MPMTSVTLIVATRQPDRGSFDRSTLLGISLSHMPVDLRPELRITFKNSGSTVRGLSEIYNEALNNVAFETHKLVFLHDDVFIHDWFVKTRVIDSLRQFDVVGVAGSVNPQFEHPSWGLKFDAALNPIGWQDGLIRSGAVNHFDYACPSFGSFGDTPAACELLDGLFLAVNAKRAKDTDLRFDPEFRFHCYDIDFCRTAARRQLRMGTWPIAVTHGSGGNFGSEEFKFVARKYLEKWKET